VTAAPDRVDAAYVLAGGRVSDVGARGRRATAVRVDRGRIAEVGGDELVDAARAKGVAVVDAGQRFIGPGFVDAHAHVEVSALADQTLIDCRFPTCRSIDDVLQRLHDGLPRAVDGWLVGQANLFWNLKLAEQRFPTRAELDSVSQDVAIVVRAGGHASVLNSKAFALSDVARYEGQSAMFGKAVVERDRNGELTGLIGELDNALPLPQPSPDTLDEAIRSGAVELFTRHGVTAVGEISDSQAGLRCMDALLADGRLPLRIAAYLWVPGTVASVEDACRWPAQAGLRAGPEWFGVRGVKLFADGGYSTANAALLTPYEPSFAPTPGYRGEANVSQAELEDALRIAHAAGLQLAVHANGEAAQALVCDAARAVMRSGVRPALRIEHAGNVVTDPGTPALWREAAATVVPNPPFLHIGFGDFLPRYMGEVGRQGRFPFRRLLDDGWSLAGSSDMYLGGDPQQTNPLFGIWCSVARTTFLGEVVEPAQAITLEEAWHMYTLAGAQAIGRGEDLGSLEVGKRADMVVLERDPADVAVNDLPALRVDHVFVDGARRWSRSDAAPLAVD
jgi:predicted amidohydrolase YtcJ